MKLGTVLASVSAGILVMAQPAAASTRSVDSLPSYSAQPVQSVGRVGSPVSQSEDLVFGTALFWLVVGLIGLAAALLLVIDDDNDDTDGLPDSP